MGEGGRQGGQGCVYIDIDRDVPGVWRMEDSLLSGF